MQSAQPSETPLCRGDVHHGQALGRGAGWKHFEDAKRRYARARIHAQRVVSDEPQRVCRLARYEHRIAFQKIEYGCTRSGEQVRLHFERPERIEADDADRLATAGKLGVEPGAAMAQGAGGLLLGGALSPLAAILPFVDPGLANDANCAGLIAEASRQGAPVPARALTAKR